MILKIKHNRTRGFTIIMNQALHDCSLSAKAKGIWSYCMTLPDNWKINMDELSNHFTDGLFSIRRGVVELQEAGYVKRVRKQKGWSTTIYEVPIAVKTKHIIKEDEIEIDCNKVFGKVTSKNKRIIELSKLYITTQKNNWPTRVQLTQKAIEEGALMIEKGCRIDHYAYLDIKKALLLVARDKTHFWNKNLYTLTTLRTKCRNDRTKLNNIMDWYDDQKVEIIDDKQPQGMNEKVARMIDSCPLHGSDSEMYQLIQNVYDAYKVLPPSVEELFSTIGGARHFIKRYWQFFSIMGSKKPHCKNARVGSKFYMQFINKLEKENGISFKSGRRR